MREIAILLAAMMFAAAATACGGSDDAGGARGTVSFLTFGDPEEIKAFRNVIAVYERQQPDVTISRSEPM
ncbi:MAG: hypothetical protein ABR583_12745 [Gaiellaceae bacterium]